MQSVFIRYYSLHIRNQLGPIQYSDFFSKLSDFINIEVKVSKDYSIALTSIEKYGDYFELTLLSGDPTARAIFFDSKEKQASIEDSSAPRWVAKPTRVLIYTNDDHRIVAMENRRGCVTPLMLERFLMRLNLPEYSNRSVEITPIVSKSLVQEIEAFERIRVASIEIVRPNFDWSDHADKLHELAEESHAESSTAEVKAARGESLSTKTGMVKIISQQAHTDNPNIKNARITGKKIGDSQEQTISISNHQERSTANFDSNAPLKEQSASIFRQMKMRIEMLIGSRG